MHAHRCRNQSGARKSNEPLFGEQWILLFSKSKMAEVFSANQELNWKFKMAAPTKVRPCWKTAHQPRGKHFHGNPITSRIQDGSTQGEKTRWRLQLGQFPERKKNTKPETESTGSRVPGKEQGWMQESEMGNNCPPDAKAWDQSYHFPFIRPKWIKAICNRINKKSIENQ